MDGCFLRVFLTGKTGVTNKKAPRLLSPGLRLDSLEESSGRLIEVNPAYTSQTCSECGHVEKENRKSQTRFLCVSCGFAFNADTNVAINIRRLGMAQLHGEGRSGSKQTSATREIDRRLFYG